MKLTTEGARFYRDGAQMLRRFEQTIRRFQADTAVDRQLKVGMGPALSKRMLMRAIQSFQNRYPEIRAHYFFECDVAKLDRNDNKVPCETLCGQKTDEMCDRIKRAPMFTSNSRMSITSTPAVCRTQ